MSSNRDKKKFNSLLVESIIEGLDFGEVILRFLELNSNLDRNRIADEPEFFAEELEKTFGLWTARIFKENILQLLCRKINIAYSDVRDMNFPEAVREAYRQYSEAF